MILSLLLLSFMAQISDTPKPQDLGVPEYGSIEGVVVDPDGKPVEGATVYAVGDNYPPMSRAHSVTTKANGEFVLDQVIPDNKIDIHAFKEGDYYVDVIAAFDVPPKWEMPHVEVKPGQTVTGVRVQLMAKAAKLHLLVHDADTKQLVHGIFFQLCREDHPTHCTTGSGPADFENSAPVGVGISIKVSNDKHSQFDYQWEYRDPKTGSPYLRAKSGETETVNVYLRKKRL
jgi:hypothetical protein